MRLSSARYANLAIEGELAMRLSQDLPRESPFGRGVLGAIESVFPVIELHHYVLPRGGLPLAALIASSGMHAGLVLRSGRKRRARARVPMVKELEVTINDSVVGMTREPWTMGGPAIDLAVADRPPGGVGLAASARPGDPDRFRTATCFR